ncbi:MAG: DMT family transporter [Rhodospirillales bacterium]|jgi:drug/metabolite transporter (DMT)-like permease|nr:DMT family transporter [Rhodospirillales bacterium]
MARDPSPVARSGAGAPSALRGMALVLVATFCGAAMQAITRGLSGELHPFELVFFRFFFGFLVLAPVLLRLGLKPLATRRLGLHALRGVLQVATMMMVFMGLSMTELATVAALQFSSPLFGTVLALLFLGEVVRARRITALAVGFAGMLVIVRPGVGTVEPGALLIMLSALVFAFIIILLKIMARTESSLTMTLYMGLFTVPFAFAAMLPFWRMPSPDQWPWLIALGILGSLSNLSFVQALREAEVTAILPFEFAKLPFSALIGYLAFAEVPDTWTWVGGAMIFLAITYIAYRERDLRRARVG